MKTASIIVKVVVALAAVAGVVYVIAAYGDKIVAWCKKMTTKKVEASIVNDGEEDDEAEPCEVTEATEAAEAAPAEDVPTASEEDFEG